VAADYFFELLFLLGRQYYFYRFSRHSA
jgi:hypothetical protein